MTPGSDTGALVVVDTNVLLAATDRSRGAHVDATAFLERDERSLALTPQIVREYLVVATRPVEVNGFGLSGEDAVANVQEFLEDMELLPEEAGFSKWVLDVVGRDVATGKQVHDANIVAVALAHGASAIVTDDTRHFARFASLIAIESLTAP